MEKTETQKAVSPELLEHFENITSLNGTGEFLKMIEEFYEATLTVVDYGGLGDDKNHLRYIQMKNLKSLFRQAQKDFDLLA